MKMRLPAAMAWEYGPIAAGACLVEIALLAIVFCLSFFRLNYYFDPFRISKIYCSSVERVSIKIMRGF
jgi:hypothetical protein